MMSVASGSTAINTASFDEATTRKYGYFRSSTSGSGGRWHHSTKNNSSSMMASRESVGVETTTTTTAATAETETVTGAETESTSSTSDKKCEGKDALCKAMGTLFLQHRVDKLQKECDSLQSEGEAKMRMCNWKRSSSGASGGGGYKGRCPKRYFKRAASATNNITLFQQKERDVASQVWQRSSSSSSHGEMVKSTKDRQRAQKVIVADVSLLIYSLRTVYNWLKEDAYRIVVPAEALRTLDVLKKGDHCLNLAARKATRFLDERFQFPVVEKVGEAEGRDPSLLNLKPGLYAQKYLEKVNSAEWTVLESALHDEIHDGNGKDAAAAQVATAGLSQEDIRHLTHSARETLACFLYFVREHVLHPKGNAAPDHPVSVHLALALPPPHFDCSSNSFGEEGSLHNQGIKYGQRADGSLLLQTAKRLGMGDAGSNLGNMIIVAPTAASWLSANANIEPPK